MSVFQAILSWLGGIDPEQLTYRAVFAMLIMALIFSAFTLYYKGQRLHHFASYFLTTLGILGTFVGITIGLLNFNSQDIDGSIPALLEGLKMAFITSIAGMFFALAVRLLAEGVKFWTENRQKQAVVSNAEVTPAEILGALNMQLSTLRDIHSDIQRGNQLLAGDNETSVVTNLQKLRTDLRDELKPISTSGLAVLDVVENINQAIAGDAQSSVVMQLQKIRSDIVSGFENTCAALLNDERSINTSLAGLRADLKVIGERVAQEFHDFAEKVSEVGAKQFIQALEQAIRDFNANLTEQFGNNFKRLDESVQKLLEWQDNYREQLAEMDAQFNRTIAGIARTETSLGLIVGHAEAIPVHMNSLEAIIRTSDAQLTDLKRHLEAFADMKNKAVQAMPELQARIDEVMGQMRQAVNRAADHYEKMLADANQLINAFNHSWLELHKQFASETQETINAINNTLTHATEELAEGADNIHAQLEHSAKNMSQSAERLGQDMQIKVNQVFENVAGEITRNSNGLNKLVNDSLKQTNEHINDLIGQLDKAMEQELERTMQTMANQLGSITNKFVQDYTKLVDVVEQVLKENQRISP